MNVICKTFLFFARLVICLFGTICVILVWLPHNESYYHSDDTLIQSNDGIIGYEVRYYSRVQIPDFIRKYCGNDYYMPPYAKRLVALMGHKKLGFTPFDSGPIGRTIIYWSGFLILLALSFFIIYSTTLICRSKFLNDSAIWIHLFARVKRQRKN
jgi:hypothetical protein